MFVRSFSLGVVAAALMASGAYAADLMIPTTPQPIMESSGFSWDGLYAGIQGGGQFYPGLSYGIIGAHVGANFVVASPLLIGIEATAEYMTGGGGNFGEFFVLGRAGVVVTDQALVYAIAGTGVEVDGVGGTFGTYVLGGGVELAVTDNVSIRAQVTGVGFYGSGTLFDGTKATVGASYHF